MNRTRLLKVVKLMFACLMCAWVLVLLISVGGKPLISSKDNVSQDSFDDVQLGETALRYYKRKRVWVTRWTSTLREQVESLAPYVINDEACDASLSVCALSASTKLDGIDLRFVDSAPPQLPKDTPWHGGFVDPTSGLLYDRAGRAYKGQQSQQAIKIVVEF